MTNHHVPPYLSDSLPGQAGWPIGLAHRGADVQRENTMGAVRAAVEQGFGYIEVDVRASADGKVVVFHDERLERITTGSGKLSDHTWDELSTLTVSGPRPRYESVAEPLVLFEQLLETFPAVRFNVDLTDRQSAAPMVEIFRCYNARDRVAIASFSRLASCAVLQSGQGRGAGSCLLRRGCPRCSITPHASVLWLHDCYTMAAQNAAVACAAGPRSARTAASRYQALRGGVPQ